MVSIFKLFHQFELISAKNIRRFFYKWSWFVPQNFTEDNGSLQASKKYQPKFYEHSLRGLDMIMMQNLPFCLQQIHKIL